MDITWDADKARTNRRKHRVDFTEAQTVLFDPAALVMEDPDAVGEQRFIATGMATSGRILVVVYTLRAEEIRLISARRAEPHERRDYETGI